MGRQVRHYERTRPGARLHVEIKSSAAFPKAPDINTTEASLRRTRMSPPNATPFNHLVGLHHCLYTTRQLYYETIAFPAASVEPYGRPPDNADAWDAFHRIRRATHILSRTEVTSVCDLRQVFAYWRSGSRKNACTIAGVCCSRSKARVTFARRSLNEVIPDRPT